MAPAGCSSPAAAHLGCYLFDIYDATLNPPEEELTYLWVLQLGETKPE
jgi:hypothetical protein